VSKHEPHGDQLPFAISLNATKDARVLAGEDFVCGDS
jgi:hypothetical protein